MVARDELESARGSLVPISERPAATDREIPGVVRDPLERGPTPAVSGLVGGVAGHRAMVRVEARARAVDEDGGEDEEERDGTRFQHGVEVNPTAHLT